MKFTNWEKKNAGLMIKAMISQASKKQRKDILDGYASAVLDDNFKDDESLREITGRMTRKQKENFLQGYIFYHLEDSIKDFLRNGHDYNPFNDLRN